MSFSLIKLFSKKSAIKAAVPEASSTLILQDVEADESVENSEPIPATTIYSLYVVPYVGIFKSSKTLDGIKQLIDYLDMLGDVPSIRQTKFFRETNNSSWGILSRTTLSDHSRHVTDNLLNLFQSTFGKNILPFRPMLTVLGLGHDIGKIRFFSSDEYVTANHPIVSAQVVRHCFDGFDIPWLDKVENAILNHHRSSGGELDLLLKKADSLARDAEILL